MATPAQLVKVVSDSLGVPERTVIIHDRNLAKAKLRTVGGRGTGAAQMTAQDAARLLLATAGSLAVKDSTKTIQRPGNYVTRRDTWGLSFLPIPELVALPAGHTALDALAAVISAGVSGSFHQVVKERTGVEFDASDVRPPVTVTVAIAGPTPSATIRVEVVSYDDEGVPTPEAFETKIYDHPKPKGKGNLARSPIATDQELKSDLHYNFHFSFRTIEAIAKLIRGED